MPLCRIRPMRSAAALPRFDVAAAAIVAYRRKAAQGHRSDDDDLLRNDYDAETAGYELS
jgi:hypothetical protein